MKKKILVIDVRCSMFDTNEKIIPSKRNRWLLIFDFHCGQHTAWATQLMAYGYYFFFDSIEIRWFFFGLLFNRIWVLNSISLSTFIIIGLKVNLKREPLTQKYHCSKSLYAIFHFCNLITFDFGSFLMFSVFFYYFMCHSNLKCVKLRANGNSVDKNKNTKI